MSTWLWAVGAVVLCAGLFYLAYRIEPHWVAKDGRRFLATSVLVDASGKVVGRRREIRGTIMSDGTLLLGKRTMLKTRTTVHRLRARSPEISRRRAQYVLEQIPPDPDGDRLLLRIPVGSELVPTLDSMLGRAPGSTQEA